MKLRSIIITLSLIAVALTFHIVRRNSTMRGIETEVHATGANVLITADEVDNLILQAYPDIKTKRIKEIDKQAIAKHLKNSPYIEDADVSMSVGGKLTTSVLPETPVMRVFIRDDEFYISRRGKVMPLVPNHYCHLLVGSADPARAKNRQTLPYLWAVASFLHDNPRYNGIFDQAHIESNGDVILIPKLGNYTVVVGDTTCLKEKFENLWAFLDQGISQTGWDIYSKVNLKYRGQVVATKRD